MTRAMTGRVGAALYSRHASFRKTKKEREQGLGGREGERKKKATPFARKPLPRENHVGRRRPLDEGYKVEGIAGRANPLRLRDVMALYSTGKIRGIRRIVDV